MYLLIKLCLYVSYVSCVVVAVVTMHIDMTPSSWSAVSTMGERLCPRSRTLLMPSWSAALATPWCGTNGRWGMVRVGGEVGVT